MVDSSSSVLTTPCLVLSHLQIIPLFQGRSFLQVSQKSLISRADAAFQGEASTVRPPCPVVLPIYNECRCPLTLQRVACLCRVLSHAMLMDQGAVIQVLLDSWRGSKAACGSSMINITSECWHFQAVSAAALRMEGSQNRGSGAWGIIRLCCLKSEAETESGSWRTYKENLNKIIDGSEVCCGIMGSCLCLPEGKWEW